MLRFVYSLLFYLAIPLVVLRLLWRSRREPLYRQTLAERFGYAGPFDGDLIWIHAVSAGETNAAAPLISRLLDAGRRVLVTTMTPTGRERVRALFGDRVLHCYAPYDLPGAVRRFLHRNLPAILAIVDTELWPNMIHYSHARGVRTMLINARLSAKSARGYRLVAPLVRVALAELDAVAVQTEAHAARFLALGLDPAKLSVAGSIKFDVRLPADLDERASALRKKTGGRTVVLAASTHAGEEQIVLEAFASLQDTDLLLVLVPRHPHRADDVEQLCRTRGLTVVRHSTGVPCSPHTQVLLLDTMGELMYFYGIASVAFVGGSLTAIGGHNPMEPASLGVPVIMGPHLHNIEDIAARFVEAGGMIVAEDATALGRAFARVLGDEEARNRLIDNATAVMNTNRGALERVVALVGNAGAADSTAA